MEPTGLFYTVRKEVCSYSPSTRYSSLLPFIYCVFLWVKTDGGGRMLDYVTAPHRHAKKRDFLRGRALIDSSINCNV